MYANGRGVRRDDATAAYFFAMAAKQGDAVSQRMLRQVGDSGSTVPECLFDIDGRDIAGAPIGAKSWKWSKTGTRVWYYPRLAMAVIVPNYQSVPSHQKMRRD
jgi:TPR repeat protein